MINKKYCYLLTLFLITLSLYSCSSGPEFKFSENETFQKKFGEEIKKIKKDRTQSSPETSNKNNLDPTDSSNLFVPISQSETGQDKSNSFDYVDISHMGSKQPKPHFPNYETYQQGIANNPSNNLSPRIFEISYTTYLNPPFDESSREFDFIEIPETDSFGVKSSASYKNYTLVPIDSIQNAIKTINLSKTDEDIDFSKKMIVEKKALLRHKKLDRFQEKNQYIKFFQDQSSQASNGALENDLINPNTKKN